MIPGCEIWDIELLDKLLCEEDVSAITSIPLIGSAGPDCRIWHFIKNGNYSVKSRYRVAMDVDDGSNSSVNENWKFLWRIRVPLKPRTSCGELGMNA